MPAHAMPPFDACKDTTAPAYALTCVRTDARAVRADSPSPLHATQCLAQRLLTACCRRGPCHRQARPEGQGQACSHYWHQLALMPAHQVPASARTLLNADWLPAAAATRRRHPPPRCLAGLLLPAPPFLHTMCSARLCIHGSVSSFARKEPWRGKHLPEATNDVSSSF